MLESLSADEINRAFGLFFRNQPYIALAAVNFIGLDFLAFIQRRQLLAQVDQKTIAIFPIVEHRERFDQFLRGFSLCHFAYHKPSCSRAASLIMSIEYGGSHTKSRFTSLTPSTPAILVSTSGGKVSATGHAGLVKVISTRTLPPGATSSL